MINNLCQRPEGITIENGGHGFLRGKERCRPLQWDGPRNRGMEHATERAGFRRGRGGKVRVPSWRIKGTGNDEPSKEQDKQQYRRGPHRILRINPSGKKSLRASRQSAQHGQVLVVSVLVMSVEGTDRMVVGPRCKVK